MEAHNEKMSRLASEVRKFYDRKESFRIYHGSTLSTRDIKNQRSRVIDTSALNSILNIDTQNKTALVEPNVPMDKLLERSLKCSLMPPVVMELPGITVGGGFAGASGESSSYRHGLFDRSVNRVEIILGNGDVVNAAPSDPETADLFHGAAGSCGSLGVITLLELRLVDAKEYIELTYRPVASVQEALKEVYDATHDAAVEYVDGILFSKSEGVIMKGRLASQPLEGASIQKFTGAKDPWFYLHAKDVARASAPSKRVVTIPIVDYFFRYDRGAFWGGAVAFRYFLAPFNKYTRWALDSYMHTRVMNHALHVSGIAKRTIIQDLTIPYQNAHRFIEYIDESLGIWPLWLCPLRGVKQDEIRSFAMGKNALPEDILVNVGIWGLGPANDAAFVALNREMEAKVTELGGLKCLYARAYYTEPEFWDVYDKERYEKLRQKYNAATLPSVFEKIKSTPGPRTDQSVWGKCKGRILDTRPFGALYGVLKATLGGDYLLAR